MASVFGACRAILLLIAASVLAASACRRGSDSAASSPPATPPPAAAKPPTPNPAATRPVSRPQPLVEPIDPEVLKTVLPEVLGWTRTTPRGALLASPAPFSKAEARYDRTPATVHVEVQDTALSQVLLAGMSMFLTAGYEERSADGYKKSGTYRGHPGFEEWKREPRRGEINILIAKRFIVSAIGQRLESMNELAEVVNALDLAKLPSVK